MASVTWTTEAEVGLDAALRYIARDSPRAADLFGDRIQKAVERIAMFPMSGRIVPEVGRDDIREVYVGPYRLVYRLTAAEIEILLFEHGARRRTEPDA